MTKEDKELLLRDICPRLLCGVKVKVPHLQDDIVFTLCGIDKDIYIVTKDNGSKFYIPTIIDVFPYLRPMYSMTNEERAERIGLLWEFEGNINEDVTYKYQDWLNAHHLDYRGLIPMGLAIEVTEKNNPYK